MGLLSNTKIILGPPLSLPSGTWLKVQVNDGRGECSAWVKPAGALSDAQLQAFADQVDQIWATVLADIDTD